MARDGVVYLVCSRDTGVTLAVFATFEQALADVTVVDDGRQVVPWSLRGGIVTPQRRSTDVRL